MDALAIVALVAGLLATMGAIGNLISGFFGMCCPLCTIGGAVIGAMVAVPAIAGVVTGILGYRRTTQQPERYGGKGLALTGAITGALALLMTVATVVGPLLGFGCLAATAPHRPATRSPYVPPAIPSFDPQGNPQPQANPQPGASGSVCERAADCCTGYISAMGAGAAGMTPETTCAPYRTMPSTAGTTCQTVIDGYRQTLTQMGHTVPAACQ